MTNYIGWTPPPGVGVVSPPVHPETVVSVIYSDAHVDEDEYLAHRLNWSAVGDGPSIVAYAVVSEYKPALEPREYWLVCRSAKDTEAEATEFLADLRRDNPDLFRDVKIIHVREVLPAAREVVAWAVVCSDSFDCFYEKRWADGLAKQNGGTVVRLSGVMPNE